MTQTADEQTAEVAARFPSGRPTWLAAAVAAIAVPAVLLLAVISRSDDTALDNAAPASQTVSRSDGVRYDGGPEDGTRGGLSSGARSNAVPGIRYDRGPEEGSRGSGHE